MENLNFIIQTMFVGIAIFFAIKLVYGRYKSDYKMVSKYSFYSIWLMCGILIGNIIGGTFLFYHIGSPIFFYFIYSYSNEIHKRDIAIKELIKTMKDDDALKERIKEQLQKIIEEKQNA